MLPRLEDLSLWQRILLAIAVGDMDAAGRLHEERKASRHRLAEVTAALLEDDTLTPRWVPHSGAAEKRRRSLPGVREQYPRGDIRLLLLRLDVQSGRITRISKRVVMQTD